MALLGGEIGYRVLGAVTRFRLGKYGLRRVTSPTAVAATQDALDRLRRVFGGAVEDFRGKTVLDYGCAEGRFVIAAAALGATRSIGVDIRDDVLSQAREHALKEAPGRTDFFNGRSDRKKVEQLYGMIDILISIDAFEHFTDAEFVLQEMYRLLAPGGRLLVWFGPPWKHPFGLHMRALRPLPWTHLFFSEHAIMKVRRDYYGDCAETYADIALGQMTVARFLKLAKASEFTIEFHRAIPIRRLKWLAALPGLREYCTSVVQCELVKPLVAIGGQTSSQNPQAVSQSTNG